MTLLDRRGVTVSTTNAAALERYEDALVLFHSYFGDPVGAVDAALREDPGFASAHLLRAGLFVMTSEKAMSPLAAASVQAAAAAHPNERERGHVAALTSWLDGDMERAVRLWGDILIEHPRDVLALQLAHLGDFYLGQSTLLRDRVGRALWAWDDAVPSYGYVLGMYAFGLEETGAYEQGLETARGALALQPRDPWAVHAGAHVFEMSNRTAEGITWLRQRQADWAPENGFAFHNWWHLGLFHLERGEIEQVLALYDEAIRPRSSAVVLEMVDASAMLWRLHLAGVNVGERWRELVDRWAPLGDDAHYVFNDVHAMMAFVGEGRDDEAERTLRTLERAVSGNGTNARMTREVGLPLCRALHAFGQGDYQRCAQLLLPVLPKAHLFGGSHAQRDVLSLTAVEAALRGGEAGLARSLVSERLQRKPDSRSAIELTSRALRMHVHGQKGDERLAG